MQRDSSWLLVSDWQHAGIMQKLVNHPAFSGSGSSTKSHETDGYVPDNFISQEAYAVLIAFEASALLREHEPGVSTVGKMCIGVEPSVSMPREISFDSWSSMQSPKKFPRTFWKSIAKRIVVHNEMA